MAKLTAKLFRDYFGGSWLGIISKNGDYQREIVFNWPMSNGNFSFLGTGEGLLVPPCGGILDNTEQVVVAGWRSDVCRWHCVWHNEFGGYGELQWTSQEIINGNTILYGSVHECKQENDDPTEHNIECEIYNHDNFKYTIQSHRKGLVEIVAKRIRTCKELNNLLEEQVKGVKSIEHLPAYKNTNNLGSDKEIQKIKFNIGDKSDTTNN